MTWLKLSDDFADECARARLTDAAFRTHVEGLLWTMRRETDGQVDQVDVRRFAESNDSWPGIGGLIACDFWRPAERGYQIIHHMEHQAEAEVIARRREVEAERQRRARRKKAGLDEGEKPAGQDAMSRRDNTRDESRDTSRDPGLGWSGRDGKPQTTRTDKKELEPEPEQEDWPEVNKPGSVADGSWADKLWDQER